MRILILSHFYLPEIGAASIRMKYFVEALKKSEHNIIVISPRPNYPGGKIYVGFEKKFKIYHNNETIYLPILFTSNNTIIGRMISYLSYFFFSFFYILFNSFKPDVIISSSPPLFTALSAGILSKLKGARFILDIRDIWPDIGIELGILNNFFTIKVLRIIEKQILNWADFVTVTAEGDRKNLVEKSVPPDKISIIYNGADYDLIKPLDEEKKKKVRESYSLPIDKKLIVYFGSFNYGMNDIDTLMKALELMTDIKNTFHFIAIGDGSNKQKFVNELKNRINLTSFDSFNSQDLSHFLPACDISVIPRKLIEKDTGGNLPVKCFESWAAGLPVVMSNINNPEIMKIFQESNGGIIVEPQNPQELKENIIKLLKDENAQDMGRLARDYSIQKFSRQKNALKIADLINSIQTQAIIK